MEIKCAQCGAMIEITPETGFITCGYCDSRLYLDLDQTVRHLYLKPVLKPEQLTAIISQELAFLELKNPIKVIEANLFFIPFWLIRLENTVLNFPAQKLEYSELKDFKIPTGELLPYDPELEKRYPVEMPIISLEDIKQTPKIEKVKEKIERADLIHIPFFQVIYQSDDIKYRALIDAIQGKVYAETFPPSLFKEKDRYFMTLFIVLSLIFLLEAFFIHKFWILVLAYLGTFGISGYVTKKLLTKKGY